MPESVPPRVPERVTTPKVEMSLIALPDRIVVRQWADDGSPHEPVEYAPVSGVDDREETRLYSSAPCEVIRSGVDEERAVDVLANALLGMALRHSDGDQLVDSGRLTEVCAQIVEEIARFLPMSREHDAYADPLDGGQAGYQGACHDCEWRGAKHGPTLKERAHADARQHEADVRVSREPSPTEAPHYFAGEKGSATGGNVPSYPTVRVYVLGHREGYAQAVSEVVEALRSADIGPAYTHSPDYAFGFAAAVEFIELRFGSPTTEEER